MDDDDSIFETDTGKLATAGDTGLQAKSIAGKYPRSSTGHSGSAAAVRLGQRSPGTSSRNSPVVSGWRCRRVSSSVAGSRAIGLGRQSRDPLSVFGDMVEGWGKEQVLLPPDRCPVNEALLGRSCRSAGPSTRPDHLMRHHLAEVDFCRSR